MTEEPETTAMQRESETRVYLYLEIGRFTHQFSQLEFTIRTLLAGALGLTDDQFDIVTSPYDFATLCRVTSAVLRLRYDDDKAQRKIEHIFKKCLELNTDRVRVMHGTWSIGPSRTNARHVSRSDLKAGYYFEQRGEMANRADAAQALMHQLIEELPVHQGQTDS